MTTTKDFFEEQTMSSRIKASIVSEYFPQYCKIIATKYLPERIRYIDLFAGPGIYQDGNVSTPILVARKCIADDFLRKYVWLMYNDKEYSAELENNFNREFPIGTFRFKPYFANRIIGQSEKVSTFLSKNTHSENKNKTPSLLFIDPFGYKGIDTTVLASFLTNWGNEIFIFVNTKRINPALDNDKFRDLMSQWFPTTYDEIQNDKRFTRSVSERLNLIIDKLGSEYERILKCKVYYTAFKFQEEDIDATSHYILHLTKGSRGFDLIKTVYNDFANVGTIFDGVNTYTFDTKKINNPVQELFDVQCQNQNIDKLKEEIYKQFAGRKLTASNLFEEHQAKSLYCRSHYTEALRRLVEDGKLKSDFTDNKTHKVSVLISQYCYLTFL